MLHQPPWRRPALVVQLALLRDVPGVQGIGVGLIGMRGTVAEHDDVPAGAKHLHEVVNRWGRLSPRRRDHERHDHECQAPRCGYHMPPPRRENSDLLEPM
jgi:hypothetical protein